MGCGHGIIPASKCAICAPRAVIDFETASELDVRDVGAAKYAEHPSTHILCLYYQLPGQPRKGWRPFLGESFPQELIDFVEAGGTLEAHNVAFERNVWKQQLHFKLGIVMPRRWADTMAVCAYRALPMKLEKVGDVLDLETKKDPRGKRALRLLASPQKAKIAELKLWAALHECPLEKPKRDELEAWVKANCPMGPIWNRDPVEMQVLYEYCDIDVGTETALSRKLGDLTLQEYKIWVLDQTINSRGVRVDVDFLEAAISIIEKLEVRFNRELSEITNGIVTAYSEVERIVEWCAKQGWPIVGLDKETVAKELKNPEIPPHVKRVLAIRAMMGKSSTKKYYTMRDWLCNDEKLRGLLAYHAASTGRWAGRGPQPQNYPRGNEDLMKKHGIEGLVALVKTRDPDIIELMTGMSPMETLVTALRGAFIADAGHVLEVGDFSAIEGVVTAWVAGEQWKLDAFAEIFSGQKYKGCDDIYCATAMMIVGHAVTKKDHPELRQVGKVCELAFGYMGGVSAWKNFDKSGKKTDEEIDQHKNDWREAHPMTKAAWYGLDEAAQNAIRYPGRKYWFRKIGFECVEDAAGPWLTMILPNGRRLWYYRPWLEEVEMPWGGIKEQVHFWGGDSKKGGAWTVCRGYGGTWMENAVQAISRDILVEAMIRCEKAGYPVVLTVHDEIVAMVKEDFGSHKEFLEIMKAVPAWLPGCPVGVAGFREKRYRK